MALRRVLVLSVRASRACRRTGRPECWIDTVRPSRRELRSLLRIRPRRVCPHAGQPGRAATRGPEGFDRKAIERVVRAWRASRSTHHRFCSLPTFVNEDRWTACGSGGARLDAFALEEIAQLARLEHLANDVAAADELAFDIELRDGRPAREFLDALADLWVREHVDAFELHPEM